MVALHYDLIVDGASIVPNAEKERLAHASLRYRLPTLEQYHSLPSESRDAEYPEVRGFCRTLAAGGIATNLHNAEWGRSGNENDQNIMHDVICEFILGGSGPQIAPILERQEIERETAELLKRPDIEKAVAFVAEALIEHKTLAGGLWEECRDNALRIIGKTPPAV